MCARHTCIPIGCTMTFSRKDIVKPSKIAQKISSPAGNRTPVSRVTGGDTYHYTTEDTGIYEDSSKKKRFKRFPRYAKCLCCEHRDCRLQCVSSVFPVKPLKTLVIVILAISQDIFESDDSDFQKGQAPIRLHNVKSYKKPSLKRNRS